MTQLAIQGQGQTCIENKNSYIFLGGFQLFQHLLLAVQLSRGQFCLDLRHAFRLAHFQLALGLVTNFRQAIIL